MLTWCITLNEKYTLLLITILLIIVIPNITLNAYTSTTQSYESVGIGKHEKIPENLPWYPLLVFGDNRPNNSGEVEYNPITYHIRDEMIEINPFAVIGVGDHVWNGYIDQIQHFIKTFSKVPNLWVVAGNHEWNNLPYINSKNKEGVNYWRKYVAPDLYYKDDIPGWRIVFINLRLGYMDWNTVENWLVKDAFKTSRKLIVVFHEPVYPDREASKSIRKVQDKLIPLLQRFHPVMVFQGHIHCYSEGYKDGTLYIITGGGGAPRCRKYHFHYLYLILRPNGSYTYKPVDAEEGEIDVTRIVSENTTHMIYRFAVYNSKRDIYGNSIAIPVRLKFNIYSISYGLVFMAGYGTTHVTATYNKQEQTLTIKLSRNCYDATYKPYLYDQYKEVWIITNGALTLKIGEETEPTITTSYLTITTTTTTMTPLSATLTTSSATTINACTTSNTITQIVNTKNNFTTTRTTTTIRLYEIEENNFDNYNVYILFIILAVLVLAITALKRK